MTTALPAVALASFDEDAFADMLERELEQVSVNDVQTRPTEEKKKRSSSARQARARDQPGTESLIAKASRKKRRSREEVEIARFDEEEADRISKSKPRKRMGLPPPNTGRSANGHRMMSQYRRKLVVDLYANMITADTLRIMTTRLSIDLTVPHDVVYAIRTLLWDPTRTPFFDLETLSKYVQSHEMYLLQWINHAMGYPVTEDEYDKINQEFKAFMLTANAPVISAAYIASKPFQSFSAMKARRLNATASVSHVPLTQEVVAAAAAIATSSSSSMPRASSSSSSSPDRLPRSLTEGKTPTEPLFIHRKTYHGFMPPAAQHAMDLFKLTRHVHFFIVAAMLCITAKGYVKLANPFPRQHFSTLFSEHVRSDALASDLNFCKWLDEDPVTIPSNLTYLLTFLGLTLGQSEILNTGASPSRPSIAAEYVWQSGVIRDATRPSAILAIIEHPTILQTIPASLRNELRIRAHHRDPLALETFISDKKFVGHRELVERWDVDTLKRLTESFKKKKTRSRSLALALFMMSMLHLGPTVIRITVLVPEIEWLLTKYTKKMSPAVQTSLRWMKESGVLLNRRFIDQGRVTNEHWEASLAYAHAWQETLSSFHPRVTLHYATEGRYRFVADYDGRVMAYIGTDPPSHFRGSRVLSSPQLPYPMYIRAHDETTKDTEQMARVWQRFYKPLASTAMTVT